MFEAPSLITNIPDISQIYATNDLQYDDLNEAVEQIDANIFLDTMDADTCHRWERILDIPQAETLADRRYKIKSTLIASLPYSYRVVARQLLTLCPYGVDILVNDARDFIKVGIALRDDNLVRDIESYLDRVLPLNMVTEVEIIYNRYDFFNSWKHAELGAYTHYELRTEYFD